MYYHSDPTAAQALGNLNREFSQQVKHARKLRRLYERGIISLEQARSEFRGIYTHVFDNVLKEDKEKKKGG